MRKRRVGWRYGLVGLGLFMALAAGVLAAHPSLHESWFGDHDPMANVATTPVRRTDLSASLTSSGRVASSNQTIIECELEALDVGVRGNRIGTNGSSTVLSVLPEGSLVKTGDVICVLDASDYEELVRQQEMNVDRARADFRQAELNLDVARMAVSEYRDGLLAQSIKVQEGKLSLAEADYERQTVRLAWARRMVEKGYLARSQLSNEEFSFLQLTVNLERSRTSLKMLRSFDGPLYLKVLDSDIRAAEATLNFQTSRLQRNVDRLEHLKRQVERCTIRAPHDGFLVHANDQRKAIQIEEGMMVRQRQKLFYLPDLSQMEVEALLHESIVQKVKVGQRALVRVEGLAGRTLEGHVESIEQVPEINRFSEVKYFVGMVKIDTMPRGLRPGMTAEVEIKTMTRPNVLVIPAEAMTVEQGQEVCYIARDDHLERREVKIGQGSRDLLEVTEGLDEGELVVLDPTHITAPVESPDPSGVETAASGDIQHTL